MRSMSDATFITTIVSICVAFLGAMGVMAQTLSVQLGRRIDGLRDEMHLGFAAVNARFDDMNRRIDDQSARITRVEQRLDALAQIVAEHEGRLK
jgi:hypothetical protein